MYLCMYPSSMNRRQPRPTLFPYTTLFRSQLEAEDEIIRIPHERAAPLQSRAHVALVPDVEHVVQIHIPEQDRKSTRLNSSHLVISYAVFCLKKKKQNQAYDKVYTNIQGDI